MKELFLKLKNSIFGYKSSFDIKSDSSNEIYRVTFKLKNKELISSCTCKAGENGYICKHRTDLLIGDYSSIINPDVKAIETLKKIIDNSELLKYKKYLHNLGLLKQIKKEKFNYKNEYFSNTYLDEELEDESIFFPDKDEITLSIEQIEKFLFNEGFLISKCQESEVYYCWSNDFEYLGEISKQDFKTKYPIGTKSNKFEINGKTFSCLFPKYRGMMQYCIISDNHPLREIFKLSSIKQERKILNYYVNMCSSK